MIERLLGIVGGVGPEATADYYRRMIDRWRVRGPASTYPSFIIDSLNSRKALDSILAGDLDPIGAAIAGYYPAPNRLDPVQNFVSTPKLTQDVDQFNVRVEH